MPASSLLDVPPELRDQIFDLLIATTLDEDCLDRTSCFPLPSTLRTCRILRLEARESYICHLQAAINDIPRRTATTWRAAHEAQAAFVPSQPDQEAERRAMQLAYRVNLAKRTVRDRNLRMLARLRPRMLPKGGVSIVKQPRLAWWRDRPKRKEWTDKMIG
ncbi:hypothetical protein LTR95_004161 [Oleoguttula sp. CCFEE 5521]